MSIFTTIAMAITSNSAGIYLFKINNGSSTIREICSKLPIKKQNDANASFWCLRLLP